METTVLVLCGSDRCLAPACATVLRSALQTHGEWQVQVLSAGVRAEVGRGWCHTMSEHLTRGHDLAIRPHRAQQVTSELVRAADLILVAERKHRGSARLLDSTCAPRTFTLVEAAALASAVIAATPPPTPPTTPPTTPQAEASMARLGTRERLVWLLQEMDAMRGIAALPEQAHGWRRRFSGGEVSGVDILDPDDGRGSHRKAVPALRQALESFASSLADAAPSLADAAPRPVLV
jgi:protein-tyrosine-phosphatase